MVEPFLCRVCSAGVPHNIPHGQVEDCTISGLSAEEMCKLYWTLRSITVAYSFSINGISLAREFTAQTSAIPKNRLIRPVEFYQTGYDSVYDTSYLCRLNLGVVYEIDDTNFGLKLLAGEVDSTGSIDLSTVPAANMSRISREFQFLNTISRIYLNYDPNVVHSASIGDFVVKLEFFD